jgi:hypothetical protein
MPLRFRKVLIADERFESAAFIDVDGNGVLDIVSGEWWYEGPAFKKRHRIGAVRPEGEYFCDFSNIPLDIAGKGRTDYVTGSWWSPLVWRENPGAPDKEWPLHEIDKPGAIERPCAWDVDGDGVVEIVPNCPGSPLAIYKLDRDANGRGQGSFTKTVIGGPDFRQGHGLGCGDIAGNGRMDLVLPAGWLEAPPDPYRGEWKWHGDEFALMPQASVPILVVDVTGNGVNDLIVGGGHCYGLDWWEHRRDGARHEWTRHPIDPFNSQYHDMKWMDIDGDGATELVTGKRYRAHCGNDPGEFDDYGAYYFKWTGEGFAKQVIDYGPTRTGKGLGIYFDTADLTGNGLPDILAPGKDGLYILYNEGL